MEQNKMIKKIGILGGSFDPIHKGHINIAQSAYQEYALDEVWFMPAGHSPNKDESAMTSAEERADMVELAIEEYPYFKLSRFEMERSCTSYTYLTLTALKEAYPNIQFYFIMGADSLDYFETWRHPEVIAQMAIILVAVRDELALPQIQEKIAMIQKLFPAEIHPIIGGRTDISSTLLRQQIKDGICDTLLPEKVAEYIHEHSLYRTN